MPVLTCMVTEPAEISAMNSAAITMPTGCRLPSMATTMPLKPKSPATPSISRRVLPLIWTAPARPQNAPLMSIARK